MAPGKSYYLFSGAKLTNTFEDRSFNTLRFATVSVGLDVLSVESGVAWRIRGEQVIDGPSHLIGSGELLVSGSYTILTSGFDYYEQLKIGLKARQTGTSGVASVLVFGKV